MTYGIIVNQKEIEMLEQNDVEFSLWDFSDVFNGVTNGIEIEFDSESEREKAQNILGR